MATDLTPFANSSAASVPSEWNSSVTSPSGNASASSPWNNSVEVQSFFFPDDRRLADDVFDDGNSLGLWNSSENESSTAEPDLPLSHGSKAVFIFLYTFTAVMAVVGNSLAILVFAKGKRSKTDLRPFLMNLAVADLIMAVFCIPFTFTFELLKEWIFSDPMCPVVLFLQTVSVTASVSTNMAIGIDRFMAVYHPLRTRVTHSKFKYVIVAVWVFACAFSSVNLVVGRTRMENGRRRCGEQWPEPVESWTMGYTMFIFVTNYFIPLSILLVTYSIIGRVLWRRTVPGNADENRDANQLKSKRRVVKMLVTVVSLFGFCWFPLHMFFLIHYLAPRQFENLANKEELYVAAHWLSMANSFVNPIIYVIVNQAFRSDLRSLLLAMCCCHRRLSYRPGAKRWKGSNVQDATFVHQDGQNVAHNLLTLKKYRPRKANSSANNGWQNGGHSNWTRDMVPFNPETNCTSIH